MSKQQILISLEGVSKIVGPEYGKPVMKIQIDGMDNMMALSLINTLQSQLLNNVMQDHQQLKERIITLTNPNLNGSN